MKRETQDRLTSKGKHLEEQLKALKGRPYVKVGIPKSKFGTAKESDSKNSKVSLGKVGVWNEFGTEDGRVPERSFIRSTHDEQKENWLKLTDKLRAKVMAGMMTVDQALGTMGLTIQSAIQKKILSNVPPPNKPSTIKAKTRAGRKGDKTLVNFGQLLQGITFEKHAGTHGSD